MGTQDYVPILIQAIVAIGFAASALISSVVLGRAGKRNRVKDLPYECGMPTQIEPSPRFSVKFYMVAMLFILFDIEVVFLYPWAVAYRDLIAHGPLILLSMFAFVFILLVGFVYALKKGALEWNKR